MSFKKSISIFGFLAAILIFSFNNCSRSAEFQTNANDSTVDANATAAGNLLELLDDARDTEARLREQGSPEAVAQADKIRSYIDAIEGMIGGENGLDVADRDVLDLRDYLLNSHLIGRDMLIEYNFQLEIDALHAEDRRLAGLINDLQVAFADALTSLEARLRLEIQNGDADIQAQIDLLRANFESFQLMVENRFVEVDGRLVKLETVVGDLQQQIADIDVKIQNINVQIENIKNDITNIEEKNLTAITNLQQTLMDFKTDIQIQIVNLTKQNVDLSKQLLDHQNAYKELIKQQNTLASLQGRLCQMDTDGSISAGQVACQPSSSEEDVLAGSCCLTAETMDCDILFGGDSDEINLVRNQCNAFVVNVINRDQQVKELATIQAEQQQMIDRLASSIVNIQKDISSIKSSIVALWSRVDHLQDKINRVHHHLSVLDDKVLILELQAATQQAIAGLDEMSNLYLAWIGRRQMDVRSRFCRSNVNGAYTISDYESAKHNWVYCKERLKYLSEATELVQLAKAYTSSLGSLNLEQKCNYTVSGRTADSITSSEFATSTELSQTIIENCNSGIGLVKALLVNIVKLHGKIGPDFRTAEYMAKKAKIIQLLYFGTEVASASLADIKAFENVDPSTPELADTYYGRIERPFKRRYVETRLRVQGKYPEDPSQLSGSIAGFSRVYSREEIAQAGTPFLERVRALELEGYCEGCDFIVAARNKTQPGSERYSYPKDAKTQCPVQNDQVMVRSDDGKHYAYRLNYTRYAGATETLSPYWSWRSTHYPIAESDEDMNIGKFRRCGYRVRHLVHRFGIPDTRLRGRLSMRSGRPYAKSHGMPQCRRAYFGCRLWEGADKQGEWTSPSPQANLLLYLNGYSEAKVQTMCDQSGVDYTVTERELSQDEKSLMRYYKGPQDSSSKNIAGLMNDSSTQLTGNYWMLKDQAISYGAGNNSVSQTRAFFGNESSYGFPFFRKLEPLTDFTSIKVQQCFDGNP